MRSNLTNLVIAAAFLLLVSACFFRSNRNSEPASATPQPSATPEAGIRSDVPAREQAKADDKGDFIVKRKSIETKRFQQIDSRVRANKLLEKAADQLNQNLTLPYDIILEAKDCGEQNAFYDPTAHSVTICYELMDRYFRTFKSTGISDDEATDKMFDATRFVFLHEIGHALIDAYQLPITGSEEDAADRLATFVNLKELGEDGARTVFAAADAFAIESRHRGTAKRRMADEHLLQEQRFYNSLCMLYGSNPKKFANIVSDKYLPKERATSCKDEYERSVESWEQLLRPWRKGQ